MTKTKPEPTPSGDPENELITAAELAHMVDRSVRWVHMLREAGKIVPVRCGLYRQGLALRAALAAVEEGLRSKAQRTKLASATSKARTREIELRTAERPEQLVSRENVLEVINTTARLLREVFAGFADRIDGLTDERRRELDAAVNPSLARAEMIRRDALAKIESGKT